MATVYTCSNFYNLQTLGLQSQSSYYKHMIKIKEKNDLDT